MRFIVSSLASLILFVVVVVVSAAEPVRGATQDEPIKSLGTYSNVTHTHGGEDEHAVGYTVALWQNREQLIGVFTSQYGLADMKPCGLLTDVKYDAPRKSLKFESKLSEGSTFDKNKKQVPTRDLFEFSGTLDSTVLRGRLKQVSMLDSEAKQSNQQVKNIELRKTNGIDASKIDAKTFSEWKKQVGEQLKLDGPKW
ncbi:MAG TPA: hypothetical protein V6C89_13110 [Drouetiella sp.]